MTADKGPDAFRTISEVAAELELPQHVLRFWETKFSQIRPMKRGGGRRFYRPSDIELLRGIRQLLYGDGLTIRGVQKLLKERGGGHVAAIGRGEASAFDPAGEAGDFDPAGGAGEAARVHRSGTQPPLPFEGDESGAMLAGDDAEMVPPDAQGAPRDPAGSRPSRLFDRLTRARAEGDALPAPVRDRLGEVLADLLACKKLLDEAR